MTTFIGGGPTIGVLALQGDVAEHLRLLETAGAKAVKVRTRSELARVDALVLPGGESTTIIKLAAAFDLLEPLRKAVKTGLPMYGSCAGMILLADRIVDGVEGQETIGGLDVLVRRNAFGRQVDSFETDLEFAADPTPMRSVFIRAPAVEATGPDVTVLARVPGPDGARGALDRSGSALPPATLGAGRRIPSRSSRSLGRIVAVAQGPLLATAFHPELTGDDRVHRFFVDLVQHS